MPLEQTALSDFIKFVHQDLRNSAKKLGADEAWKKHCDNEEDLQKYAGTMQSLACDFWEKHHQEESKIMSRIAWTYDSCKEYFVDGGLSKHREKELTIALKMDLNFINAEFSDSDSNRKLKLLDVGSCYNPFKVYDCFSVTAIDIAPATEDVAKCDFLNLNIGSKCKLRNSNVNVIIELPKEDFDVIVFSLLLEYLPSTIQRLTCCEKAYKLLKTEGLLVIITPDSKHVGANTKYMKSWRCVLSKLGFSRIKYEKLLHIHCMVFRKSLDKAIPHRWAILHDHGKFFDELFIPQDFKEEETNNEEPSNSSKEPKTYINIENELPFCNE